MKTAKDGSRRGRPPLFGEAGHYERVFAAVSKDLADRIRLSARTREVSLSSILLEIAEGPMDSVRLAIMKGGVRIYAQLRISTSRRLKAEAERRGWAVSALLGSMAWLHFKTGAERIAN